MRRIKTKASNNRLIFTFISIFFVFSSIFTLLNTTPTYATRLETLEKNLEAEQEEKAKEKNENDSEDDDNWLEKLEKDLEDEYEQEHYNGVGSICKDQSGAISWIICPTTGAVAKASDAIYSVIEDILQIKPNVISNDSTIHIVWQYTRDITNIVFIILLLTVVISHLTGFGLSNYNIKRILPRLVVVSILVNLSFIICQAAIDISNILGASLRGAFYSIEEQAIAKGATDAANISWSSVLTAITGTGVIAGTSIVITGGLGTFFWAIIPILLGAIVSVIIGLITISLRQGLIMVLAMISPLAFVCFLLPNTEGWFKKWKSLFMKMLIFYPMFSFLFGATHIAGWAIITSSVNADGEASDFGVIVGLVIQIFPLFGSWSLMKMSGTILGTINDKLHGLAAKPLAAINRNAMFRRDEAKSKYFGGTPKGLSQEIMQKVNDRQVKRMENIKRYNGRALERGIAYSDGSLRKKNGAWTKRAEDFYEMQADSMEDQETIARIKNDFNKGIGQIPNGSAAGTTQSMRLQNLDIKNMNAADNLKYQLARGATIDYDNAKGFYDRSIRAINAHFDDKNQNVQGYVAHDNITSEDLLRYNKILNVADGKTEEVHNLVADASYNYNAHRNVLQGKLNAYNTLTPATQDVVYHLEELTRNKNTADKVDLIISGLRTLNDRGDTDLMNKTIDEMLIDQRTGALKVQLGTNASQSLANFLMFEVKDKDPFLRRFGKYINLQTAKCFNADPSGDYRRNRNLTMDEYITGYYEDVDENGNKMLRKAKKSMTDLLNGTSFKNMERTTLENMTRRIAQSYTNKSNNTIDMEAYTNKLRSLDEATFANFISDQFSWLSGSEEITSFAKYITGVKKDDDGQYETDWKGIFGKQVAHTLTDDDKRLFEEFQSKRTKNFLKGQVANQVARTKSDVLNSIIAKFEIDADPSLSEEDRKEAAGQTFIESLNTDVYDNLISMYDKGFQGDTKANLVTAIHLNDPAQISRVRKKKSQRNIDDDAGHPTPSASPAPAYDPTLDARSDIHDIYHASRLNTADVTIFWNQARSKLIRLPDYDAKFGSIEAAINSYTDITTLYNDILSCL